MEHGKFKVIYNQDCTNLFVCTQAPIEPHHVEHAVDEVADGGADVMLVNPNSQRVSYPSKVWQTFWDGYSPSNRSFFGSSVPPDQIEGREHWVAQMKRLADMGCDYVECALSRCRERKMTPGVTVRMNDMHDVPWPDSHVFNRFYLEHPEYHLAEQSHAGWGGTGLNYECPAVREHHMRLIRELVERYDFEVLELDFLRFSCYFPRRSANDPCQIMTRFIREVRNLCDQSGRKIALMPRIAATPAGARELGFDASAWAKEGLVEGITVGAFLNTDWQMPIEAWREWVGDDIRIFVTSEFTADRRDGLPVRWLPTEPTFVRGFAAGYLAAGADGVNIFNYFCVREGTPSQEPVFDVMKELKSPESLRGKSKTYLLTSGTTNGDTDEPVQVPVELAGGQSREFHMLLAAERPETPVQAVVVFEGSSAVEKLWLQINHTSVGSASRIEDGPAEQRSTKTAIFSVPSAALRNGRNRIILRNEGEKITLVTIEIHIGR